MPGASYAEIGGEYERLKVDVVRAIERSHWALLHLDAPPDSPMYPPATQPGAGRRGRLNLDPITADALLPDGRQARIVAWGNLHKLSTHQIAVAIRVGPFGSPREEQRYVNKLAKTLAGKPKPKRGGKFELP